MTVSTFLKHFAPAAALAIAYAPSQADTIAIVADEWCPFNCATNANDPGFMIEIAAHALEAQGHEIAYQIVAWDQAIERTRKGEFTAIVGAARSDAPDFVYPEEGQGFLSNVFYTSTDSNWTFTDVSSLEGVRLGVIEDYSYTEEIDAFVAANPSSVFVASGNKALEQLIEKLLEGEIDALIESGSVFSNYFVSNELLELFGNFREAGGPEGEPIYVAFSPANPHAEAYAKTLSEATAALRASGELAEILKKYLVSDWK